MTHQPSNVLMWGSPVALHDEDRNNSGVIFKGNTSRILTYNEMLQKSNLCFCAFAL